MKLFGPDRALLGHDDTEWSVWVSGQDAVHPKGSLSDALELANELNATFAALRFESTSEFDPICYAVVLHRGYAWTAETEHKLGLDCGVRVCGPCSFNRAIPRT